MTYSLGLVFLAVAIVLFPSPSRVAAGKRDALLYAAVSAALCMLAVGIFTQSLWT